MWSILGAPLYNAVHSDGTIKMPVTEVERGIRGNQIGVESRVAPLPFHDNARRYVRFNPDLALSDYHLFPHVKLELGEFAVEGLRGL